MFGGLSFGHQMSNTCQVEDPNFLRFCDQSRLDIPYYTQLKLSGNYDAALEDCRSAAHSRVIRATRGMPRWTTLIAAEDPSLRVNWEVDRTTFKTLTGQTLTQSSVAIPLERAGDEIPRSAESARRSAEAKLHGRRSQSRGPGRRL